MGAAAPLAALQLTMRLSSTCHAASPGVASLSLAGLRSPGPLIMAPRLVVTKPHAAQAHREVAGDGEAADGPGIHTAGVGSCRKLLPSCICVQAQAALGQHCAVCGAACRDLSRRWQRSLSSHLAKNALHVGSWMVRGSYQASKGCDFDFMAQHNSQRSCRCITRHGCQDCCKWYCVVCE